MLTCSFSRPFCSGVAAVDGVHVRVPAVRGTTVPGFTGNVSGAPVDLLVWFTPGGFEQLFVTYRTHQANRDVDGFVAEASGRFNSQFE
jgi:hypothetical protein